MNRRLAVRRQPRARLLVLGAVLALPGTARAEDWPAWRGPTGQGLSTEEGLPVRWTATEGVLWRTPLPDRGNSTAIVRGGRVYLTQAVKDGKERSLLAIDRRDGKVLWTRTVAYPEAEPTHGDNPYCSASPAAAGDRVVVSHGSAGVFAYDLEGKELWRRDVGKLHHIWGNAASPVIHGDLCFLNCGPGPRTFLTALALETGSPVWTVEVPGGLEGGDSSTWTGSWSTPLLARSAGREELLVGYPHRLRAFQPRTGKELWSCEGLGRLVYTSPLFHGDVAVAMSGFGGPALAVRAGGEGDVTGRRLWRHERAQQRIGSGIILAGRIYMINETGVCECLELETGKTLWRERVCGATWSSLLHAGGLFYIPDQSGECTVFRASPSFEVVAKNPLGETTRASLAASEGQLFLRTYRHLYCIGKAR